MLLLPRRACWRRRCQSGAQTFSARDRGGHAAWLAKAQQTATVPVGAVRSQVDAGTQATWLRLTFRISSMLMGAATAGSAAAAACCLAGAPPLAAAAAVRLAAGGCAAAACRRSLSSPADPSSDPLPSRRLRCCEAAPLEACSRGDS